MGGGALAPCKPAVNGVCIIPRAPKQFACSRETLWRSRALLCRQAGSPGSIQRGCSVLVLVHRWDDGLRIPETPRLRGVAGADAALVLLAAQTLGGGHEELLASGFVCSRRWVRFGSGGLR